MPNEIELTGLYAEIQQFYADQMHLLDNGRTEGFASTFTVDGSHQPSPENPPARGRTAIAEAVRNFDARYENDPVVRRHWFNMMSIREISEIVGDRDDSDTADMATISVDFYAMVVATRPGAAPVIPTSCVVHDVLLRTGEELFVVSRTVDHDRIRAAQLVEERSHG